ncbi:MAG: alkaline phosphatase family protein [Pyrinomonadaceae bacterium MAG19_C2-C3]|nr:alkaline phosphatase family protein [Pyrinomonadaceae bacterium MAG19_C2-C3]
MKLLLAASLIVACASISFPARVRQTAPPRQAASDSTRTAARKLLRAGPMLGASEMTEVSVWVQTTLACDAQLRFWERTRPNTARLSEVKRTSVAGDMIARFNLSGLTTGTGYDYELYLNNERVELPYATSFQTQTQWRFRTDPPAFRVAIGSCTYINDAPFDRPGTPYGAGYEIFDSILREKPDLMIWLGDNVYFREPDWLSEAAMRRRYSHTRATPEMQALLASVHNYAVWDDHDYGPNDSDRTFRGREWALNVFRDYWANSTYGTLETPGVFGRFEWGDVEFFMLDDRTYRSPNNTTPSDNDPTMWGDAQFVWLRDALRSSNATFKIVVNGSQVMNPLAVFENLAIFPFEQQKLIDFIRDARIEGVMFLSGDRHHTELIRRDEAGLYPLYDFTSSALTSGGSRLEGEANNPARVAGTWVTAQRNFGLLEFSGAAKERRLVMRTLDTNGKELWRREVKASELRFPVAPRSSQSSL